MTSSIDVTQNSQYIALKQSYDTQIDKDQKVEDLWTDLNNTQDTLRYTSCPSPEADALAQRYQDDMTKISSQDLDPTGAIRTQIVNGQDPVALLKQQQTDALNALASTLLGQDDVDKANKDAQGVPPTPPPPINVVINNYGNDGAHRGHRKHHGGTPGDDPDTTGSTSGGGHHAGGTGNTSGKDKTPATGGTNGTNGTNSTTGTDGTTNVNDTDKPDEDIMTRALMVMAMLGQACDGCSGGYMDNLDDNCNKIDDLNGLSQTVRSLRPTGTDTTKTATLSASDVQQLQGLGVTMPTDAKPDSSGNYTISQADFDTLTNNIQSQSSSLTTMNQNTTISMNKAIDASQQCSTFQASDLEKWAQLMSKILS